LERLATYPGALSQAVQAKLICDLGSVHGILEERRSTIGQSNNRTVGRNSAYRQILLVGENQEDSVPQLILVEHALQLLTSFNDTVTIVTVDNEDDTLSILEVVPPQGANLVLSTDIPHGELDVLVLYRLDIEA
jgi:hypothetical protein